MQPPTSSKLCPLVAAEAPLEGGFTSGVNIVPNCENGQGGDIADDRLPKAEPWWADRGAEAEGKKRAVLDPSLWIVPFTLRCVAFFVHAFSWTLSNHFTRWVAGA